MERLLLLGFLSLSHVICLNLPVTCQSGQYLDPGLMVCSSCPANMSLVPSSDGFACSCEENSIPVGVAKCRRCTATEVLSSDGAVCVPRKCQKDSQGRLACRKCPADYVSVTQNFDGSPMREVQCVKCARGYKAFDNRCIRCESCVCSKDQIIVGDKCVPKAYVAGRPKYEEKLMQPSALMSAVKYEHLCVSGDVRACRTLADKCVRTLYTTDRGGPCRLWVQAANLPRPLALPQLTLDSSTNEGRTPGEVHLPSNKDILNIVVVAHTPSGGMMIIEDPSSDCGLPFNVVIGTDVITDCHVNITELQKMDSNKTLTPYLKINDNFQPLPLQLRKPNGHLLQRSEWVSNKFRRYFIMDPSYPSAINITSIVYLRTLTVFVSIRDKSKSGHLGIQLSLEAHYATATAFSKSVAITLMVQNRLPGAGVLRGLEIWGGVLAALLSLFAVVQWRGTVHRGGRQISLLPILSGCVADAIYFASLFSTLHALAAEAGTLGLTLPLSRTEENTVAALVYAALSLKILKVVWINWKQCTCDIFFLDWSEYNTQPKESVTIEKSNWKIPAVAREWSLMQTRRRVTPGYTLVGALVVLHFLSPWQSRLPPSRIYHWVITAVCWWSSYVVLLSARWLYDRAFGRRHAVLSKVCSAAGVSLLVFQEEFYAHYVHGRNDDTPDARALSGPLASCRVVCAPQLRIVYRQLSKLEPGSLGDVDARRILLSRFLAAFFQRALDGMSWVASERTLVERLLDLEVTAREASTTSALLYEPDDAALSCTAMTWWGVEWSLATFDAMVFGCVLIAGGHVMLASLVTLIIWQIMAQTRMWFGNRNVNIKSDKDTL